MKIKQPLNMKKLLILPVFLLIIIQSFGQSVDSTIIPPKYFKNTIQTSLFGFAGYLGLQYQYAINKDWSFGLQGNITFPLKYVSGAPSGTSITASYSVNAFTRYYLDENLIPNNGLYVQAELGYFYTIQYISGHKDEANAQKKYPWLGAGIGYELLIKKRLVLAAGISIQCGTKGQMYNSGSSYKGWYQMHSREVRIPLTLNIGYAF